MRHHTLFFSWILFILCGLGLAQELDFVPISEHSRNDSPSIIFTDDGTLWLAWSSFQDGRSRLVVCSRRKGKWSSIEYPDSCLAEQLNPQWASGLKKKLCLVYTAFDGQEWTINTIEKKNDGWSNPRSLGNGTRPTAIYTQDNFWVAWEQGSKLAVLSQSDKEIHPTIGIYCPKKSFLSYSHPQLCAGPDGEVWLVWTASRHGYQSVLLKRVDGEDYPFLIVDEGRGINRNPHISVDAEGRVWIVYESLRPVEYSTQKDLKKEGRAIYELDKVYSVENPSRIVKVTDGKNWWRPPEPVDPSLGLVPNILCSRKGTVWLVSRTFTGFSRPYKYFCPLCESLGQEGWKNHGVAWLEGKCYKQSLALAEAPGGGVWTTWAQHDREKRGYKETPSWSLLDGPDRIVVSLMPQVKNLGPPPLIPFSRKKFVPPESVVNPVYQTTFQEKTYQVYFGDLHIHSEFSGCGRRNSEIQQSQHYTRFIRGLDFMCTIDHAEHLNDHNWHVTQLVSERYNEPGEFVTFTGFEWTSEFDAGGNLFRGHYNVIFRDVGGGDYYFSASDPRYNTPLELWAALKDAVGGAENVLTFPHHTSRRMAWLSWNYYDPEMVPLIEIVQARGSYEYEGCFSDQALANDCTRIRGHYIHDGLERGMRWGFVGSGDHGGCQLAAVFSPKLERNEIFRNLKAGRIYATNGKRMYLDVRINDHFMGEEFSIKGEERKIVFTVIGTSPLVQIDLFRNGRSIRQWNVGSKRFENELVDKEPLYNRENYYYVRAIQSDGGQAWSSPIWIISLNIPGKFCFQVGGDELRVIYPEQETDFSILMHNETEKSIKGKVTLEVPEGWLVKEENGIMIECPQRGWRHAVFHITAPKRAFPQPCLPEVKSRFEFADGRALESPLFVVGSPIHISREQKAVLINARTEIPISQFGEYLKKMAEIWSKEE